MGPSPEPLVPRRRILLAGCLLLVSCSRRDRAHTPVPATVTPARPVPPPPPLVPEAPAVSTPPPLRVIARSQWTREPVGPNADPMGPIRRITLHHTGEHLSSTGIADRELIQRIEHHHRRNLGWAAIGYHFLIGKDGTIYEGRPLTYQGAHSGGDANRNNVGVTVIGEFDRTMPGPVQLAALTALIADLRQRYHLPRQELYGHRDWKTTVCPGDRLYAWLRTQR